MPQVSFKLGTLGPHTVLPTAVHVPSALAAEAMKQILPNFMPRSLIKT